MTHGKEPIDFNKTIAYLFGLDRLEINKINESKLNVKAVISSGETVKTIYKIFQAFIEEMENAKNDPKALNILKKGLSKYKNDFDQHIKDTREQITTTFKNFEVAIELSYEGEFEAVYNKVAKLVI